MKIIRIIFLIFLYVVLDIPVMACDVCKKQQPKVLSGISHGAGPESSWDYIWVSLIAAIVIISSFYAVRWIVQPGENERGHIKRSILNND
jgi:hypothetical protein